MGLKRELLKMMAMLLPCVAMAEEDSPCELRPVSAAYEVGVRNVNVVDTYLSPLEYDGLGLGLRYERRQAMRFNPERWTMRLAGELAVEKADNPMRYASIWCVGLDLSWGMAHRWRLPHNITVGAGGSTSLDVGCLYSTRNGNNPVSAKAAWTVNLTGDVAWLTRLFKRRLILRYQPTVPLAGVFFAPDYGQLYYEIYLGNDGGLCHGAWWGNYFKIENRITADWYLGSSTALRIGYDGDLLSTKVNDVSTKMVSHSIVVGVSGEWISVTPDKSVKKDARVISAIY